MSTTTSSEINFKDIAALTTEARGRTGRVVDAILGDWLASLVYYQDLHAEFRQTVDASDADYAKTIARITALAVAAEPTLIKAAGVFIRRSDPVAEAQALVDARTQRAAAFRAKVEALSDRLTLLHALIGKLAAELDRAGVPPAEAQALVKTIRVNRTVAAA